MCYYISLLFTISSYNSQHNFIKFSFPESASHVECIDWKKFRKNPDSGKKPDSKIFRIFSKMIFSRNFVIIKCFYFFNITIFKATMAYEKSAREWLVRTESTCDCRVRFRNATGVKNRTWNLDKTNFPKFSRRTETAIASIAGQSPAFCEYLKF